MEKSPRLLLHFKRRGFSFISCHLYPLNYLNLVLEGFVVLGQHCLNFLHGLHSNTPFKNPVSSDRSVPKGFVVLGEQLFDSLHGFHSHAPSCFNENEISVLKSFIVGVQHYFDSLNGFHIRFSFQMIPEG